MGYPGRCGFGTTSVQAAEGSAIAWERVPSGQRLAVSWVLVVVAVVVAVGNVSVAAGGDMMRYRSLFKLLTMNLERVAMILIGEG